MKMLTLTGKVLYASEEIRSFPIKDKDGNPTNINKDHRIVKIQLLITNSDKSSYACLAQTFDPPTSFKLPSVGEVFETPEIREYRNYSGLPEVKF